MGDWRRGTEVGAACGEFTDNLVHFVIPVITDKEESLE